MNDFELPQVKKLIDSIRSKNENTFWILQYLRLQSAYIYFQYAVTQVRIQEENLKLMENGEHKNFPSHDAYAESDLRIYSSALAAYAYMRTCLHFTYELAEAVPNDEEFGQFREEYKLWAKELIGRRDRLQAHPYNEYALVWKRTMRCSDGRIEFPIRNLNNLAKSEKWIINPRRNLDELRMYIENLSTHLERLYNSYSQFSMSRAQIDSKDEALIVTQLRECISILDLILGSEFNIGVNYFVEALFIRLRHLASYFFRTESPLVKYKSKFDKRDDTVLGKIVDIRIASAHPEADQHWLTDNLSISGGMNFGDKDMEIQYGSNKIFLLKEILPIYRKIRSVFAQTSELPRLAQHPTWGADERKLTQIESALTSLLENPKIFLSDRFGL